MGLRRPPRHYFCCCEKNDAACTSSACVELSLWCVRLFIIIRISVSLILWMFLTLLLLSVPQRFVVKVHSDAFADGSWLVALYNVTNGSGWNSSCRTNWNISNPASVCSTTAWSRVTCDTTGSSGVVTSVALDNCNLQGGPLPDIAGTALANCRSLYLHSNSITGSLPSSFSNLFSLKHLFVHSNSLTGTIPLSFSSLSSLQQLHMCCNRLAGTIPPSFSSLSSLQHLHLCCNSLAGTIPLSFSSLSSLQSLYLHYNSITGSLPSAFSSLSSLQYLYLHYNSITASLPSSFGSLSSLQYVFMHYNNLTGTLPSSWYILQPAGVTWYDISNNYLTGDLPTSWLWNNATISGKYFAGNCLNVSNTTAVVATGRFDSSATPRSNASVCAAVAAAQAQAAARRTRSRSTSISLERTLASMSVSTSLLSVSETTSASAASRCISESVTPKTSETAGSGGTITHHRLTQSRLLSPSAPVTSASASRSSSACGEMAVCWARQAPSRSTCHSCTLLDPVAEGVRAATLLPVAAGAVVYTQVSRVALDGTFSLQVFVECTHPPFLHLVNRTTVTLDVVVVRAAVSEARVELLQLSLPTGQRDVDGNGWLRWSTRQHGPYKPFTLELPLAAECGDRSLKVTLEVLVTPVNLPDLVVGGAVQTTDRAATWLGAIGGGPSSAGGVSRLTAVRSLLLCSKEGASTGGLLGLSLARSFDDNSDDDAALLASARGAIVGNMLVLVIWLSVLLLLAGLYFNLASLPAASASAGLTACVRVALPSSLFPVCSALLPSLSGGVLILAVVGGNRLDTVDILTLVAGCCVMIIVLGPLMFLCASSFASSMLNSALVAVERQRAASAGVALKVLLWHRAVKPQWIWKPLPVPSPPSSNDESDRTRCIEPPRSLGARACSVILTEYRCLWFAALDMWCLCATGLLGAASGVMDSKDSYSTSVCSGAAIALTVMFALQLAVIVAVRPLTSVFGNVHAAFVLLLTGLGTALQVATISNRGRSSGSIEDWASVAVAVCGFLVVGASIVRVALMDAPHTVAAVRKFIFELTPFREKSVVKEETTPQKLKPALPGPSPMSPLPAEECTVLADVDFGVGVDTFGCCDFWDAATGEMQCVPRQEDDDHNHVGASFDEAMTMDGFHVEDITKLHDDNDDDYGMCDGGEALLLRFRI